MSQLSKLMQVTEEEKKRILIKYKTTEEEFEESVNVLKNWIIKQENFPEFGDSDENRLRASLLNSGMSLEKAKRSLEGYFTVKALYEDDIFKKLIPDERFKRIQLLATSIIMPKLLPNLCRLHVTKLNDIDGEAEDAFEYYVSALMIAELRLTNDFFLSSELLIDMQQFNLKNLIKYTPTVNTKLVHLISAIKISFRSIHIINAPAIYDKILVLMRAFFPAKIFEKIHLHHSLENLHECIPKEYLPADYGGTEKTLDELYEMWIKEFEANESVFRELAKQRVKAILRKQDDTTNSLGMGTEGSFKRLTID